MRLTIPQRVRRHLAGALGAAAITLGLIASPTPVDAHPVTNETYQIAAWWDVYVFGPENNGVFTAYVAEVHWWGSHQVRICYSNGRGNTAELLYDRISGATAWLNTSWC